MGLLEAGTGGAEVVLMQLPLEDAFYEGFSQAQRVAS